MSEANREHIAQKLSAPMRNRWVGYALLLQRTPDLADLGQVPLDVVEEEQLMCNSEELLSPNWEGRRGPPMTADDRR